MRELNDREKQAYHSYVHNPTDSNAAFYQLSLLINGTRGISTGSPVLDSFNIPTRPGWIRYWLARPGEGKSTMLRTLAMVEALYLLENGLTDKYYVAHCTWEEAIDSQELYYQGKRGYTNEEFWRGEATEQQVIAGGIDRPMLPIYFIGESMMKSTLDSPKMTMERVIDALRSIYIIERKSPSVIIIDYVQEVLTELPDSIGRTQQVIQAVRDIVDVALRLKAPIEMGVQANQLSLDRSPPIPTQRDVEYSFFTHQKSTNGLALWRPWVTEKDKPKMKKIDPVVNVGGMEVPFSPNLMVAKPLKHRPGLLRMMMPFLLYPDVLEIKDLPEWEQDRIG